jgi:hypothetical protein
MFLKPGGGKEHFYAVLPFKVLEKIVDKPLRIRGVALTAGMSRNLNIYLPEELEAFADRLVSAPVYVEHVAASNAVESVEYYVDAKTQSLEVTLELGREAPLLADYLYALKSRTDHLSRYKAGVVRV